MSTLRLTVVFILLTAVKGSMIGTGISLSKYNVLGPVGEGGSTIYESLPNKCLKNASVYQTRHTFSYYEDTYSFYKKIGTTAGIQGSLQSDFTLGFTLDSTTNSISGSNRTISGNSMHIMAATAQDTLQTSCLYTLALNSRLLEDLRNLPLRIESPWLSSSWELYQVFLNKYGSHVISGIVYGSSIDQTAFADSSKSYSERDFEIKSCMSLAGPTEAGMANMSLCGGVSQEEINEVSEYAMSNKLIVNGGTLETRNELIYTENRTPELVNKFLDEANYTRSPIFYVFRPLWEIIQGHDDGDSNDLIRGVNLEQYYTGYLSYGCTFTQTPDIILQKFELSPLSSVDVPRYQCSLARQGCHHDDDCQYRLVKCKCQDHTCVRYTNEQLNTGVQKTVAGINHQDKWYWNGCTWKVAGSKCRCGSSSEGDRYPVWSGDNKSDIGSTNMKSAKKSSKNSEL